MKARQGEHVDVLPYQFALGFTIRWWDARPRFRLYLGPVKLHW